MRQAKMQNLTQNEYLHSPLEENTLIYQSETPTCSIQHTDSDCSFSPPPKKVKIFIAATFILILFLVVSSWSHQTTLQIQDQKIFMIEENHLIEQRFPRILWVYTQNQRDQQYMQNDIYHNYFVNQAKTASYTIREVNSLTAYDYLDKQMIKNITETMNKRIIDETVHSFLKLALLLQHGGLLISPGTILLENNFRWIQYMFDLYSKEQENYYCTPEKSSLFISQHAGQYDAKILAAVPQNPFLRELLAFMSEAVMSQQLRKQNSMLQRFNISGLTWNPSVRVYSLNDSISNCINHLMKINNNKQKDICYAGIQSAKVNLTLLVDTEKQPTRYFADNKLDIINQILLQKGITNRNEVQAIIGFSTNKINSILTELAIGKFSTASIYNSLMYQVLQVPGNKEVFLEELPQRNIELCLVIMEPLTNEQLIYTSTLFNQQTYRNWRLIMPAADMRNAPKFNDFRITVMQSKSTKVHIIEKALTKHCSHQDYAVVLNFNQTFENRSALYIIAKAAQPRQVVGIYIPLKSNNESYYVRQNYTKFYRFNDGIVNPKLDMMKHMINHFRVFSVQTFRTIPQFALRDWNGKYFKDRLIFLMDFHDLIHREINQPHQLFVIKKNANIWNIPTKISILEDVATLNIHALEEVDQVQLKMTRPRVSTRNVKLMIYDLHRYRVPVSKMVAFNPGDDFVPVEQRVGSQIIPRIVHQVWLGGQIPPAKQYFIQKTKRIYSDYEIKVWRQENITREQFPTTYDIIKTLLEFNKRSPYNKLATVTDIMRHEILYREGGLWKDAGMNMLRPIPHAFLRYKLVLSTDRLYQQRYVQGMCFFGNIPKYQNMLRINNYRNLNKMRIYSDDALSIAGPVDFRQLLVGQEEFDPDIILIPYQTFYPGQVGQHPDGDLCTTKQPKKNQEYEIEEGGWYLLKGCEQKYPYAFAIEHNNYGSSWVGPKQLVTD